MSYKKLGDYIRQVNVRNKNLETDVLLGVSITKKLMPSIANVIGTDMSVYKVIEKRQFAYGTVTSRNGEKISIALSDQYDKALVSQIYVVFEVIDTAELLPEYLMMWFSRPEFDRYVRFHSHGSTRETFDWADMCEVELPIPSIEEQRQIVAQYQSIGNKIKVNEQICEKLEAIAQALYKHWFVDFEFPISHCEDREARDEEIAALVAEERVLYPVATKQGYKASGGKMVWNEELGKEIPEGWELKSLELIYKIQIGRTPSRDESKWFLKNDIGIKWISIKDINENGVFLLKTNENLSKEALKKHKIPLIPKNTVVLSFKMSVGRIAITNEDMLSNEAIASFIKKENNSLSKEYLYFFLKTFNYQSLGTTSSIVNSINSAMIKDFKIIIPNKNLNTTFETYVNDIFGQIRLKEIKTLKLTQLQSLLLSRLAVGEEEKRMIMV